MNKWVVVTGSSGGIGQAICAKLKSSGIKVVGIDSSRLEGVDCFIECDLAEMVKSATLQADVESRIKECIGTSSLIGLVNNAAVQILSGIDSLNLDEFQRSLDVNLTAPLILIKALFTELKRSEGMVVNIGSIHSELTKPGFISYATSKAALKGLTKALAVDSGHLVRFNMIQPAAIETEMLRAGFNENAEFLECLKGCHPTGRIGSPQEVALIVTALLVQDMPFLNGSVIDISGGVSSRLHDVL